MLYNQCIECDKNNTSNNSNNNCANYELNDLINNILQLNFMNNFLFKNEICSLLIINFDKINIIFKHSSVYSNNNSNQSPSFLCLMNCEEGNNIDNIFFRIFSRVFPKSSNNINTTGNNVQESNSSVEENLNQNLKHLLLINLYKMIPNLSILRYTKYLFEKISNLFKKESIISILKIYEDEFVSNNFSKNNNYLYKLLYCLLEKGYSNINIINSNTNKNTSVNNSSNTNNNIFNTNNNLNSNNNMNFNNINFGSNNNTNTNTNFNFGNTISTSYQTNINSNTNTNTNKTNNLSSLLNSNLVNLDNLQRTGPTNKWANPVGQNNNFNMNSMSNEMNNNIPSNNFYF
jgi:hypothetical protein